MNLDRRSVFKGLAGVLGAFSTAKPRDLGLSGPMIPMQFLDIEKKDNGTPIGMAKSAGFDLAKTTQAWEYILKNGLPKRDKKNIERLAGENCHILDSDLIMAKSFSLGTRRRIQRQRLIKRYTEDKMDQIRSNWKDIFPKTDEVDDDWVYYMT